MTHRKNRAVRAGLSLYCTALLGFGGYALADAFLIPRELESVGITAADLAAEGGEAQTTAVTQDVSSADSSRSGEADGTGTGTESSSGRRGSGRRGKGSGSGSGSGRGSGSGSGSGSSMTWRTDDGASDEGSAVVAQTTSSSTAAEVSDAQTYSSNGTTVTLTTQRVNGTTVYVADVRVSSADALRTAFAQGTYGRNIKSTTSEIAAENNAILAINGDYYGWREAGYVLRNGTLYRETSSGNDVLVVGADGSLYAASDSSTSARDLLASGAQQVLSFGPVLVQDGEVSVGVNDEVSQSKSSNPRTAIGMVEPLHYVFVVSDGRTDESEGLSLYELAQVLRDAGCTFAYNLDGGGSSTLWFNGEVVNNPTSGRSVGEREVSDIVYIAQ